MKKGDLVKENCYGYDGIINEVFINWDDLKLKNTFLTVDNDNESEKMSKIEKLINGDPKDNWLKMQVIPFTEKELIEKWYSIRTFNGGAIWSCESRIQLIN
jgi:hypothetical protein